MGFSAVVIGNRVGHESAEITYRYAHMMFTVGDGCANCHLRKGSLYGF